MIRRLIILLLSAAPALAQIGSVYNPPDLTPYATTSRVEQLDAFVDPVFRIENPPESGFTDFELKGSTNNFATMRFFFHSPNPDASVIAQVWPTNHPPTVLYTDSRRADRRQWIELPTDQPDGIYLRLAGADSAVGGWIVIVRGYGLKRSDWEKWLWSFVHMDGIGYPDVDLGGRSIWRPITPIGFTGEGMTPSL